MNITQSDLLSRLKKVKRNKSGWTALCPSHNDRHRSLSIFIGSKDGKLYVKCHVGCPWQNVLAAIGIGKGEKIASIPAHRKESPEEKPDFNAILQRCLLDTTTPKLKAFAESLGVNIESLKRLGAKWHSAHNAWAFPMYDESEKVIGIRLRAEDGRKWAVTGSMNGLFIPSDLSADGPLCICEGPTDNAALLDFNYPVIGRANCNSGAEYIIKFIKKYPKREIILFANKDSPKKRKDGTIFLPGQDGAEQLAYRMRRVARIILPILEYKDFREWIKNGANRQSIDYKIKTTHYFNRKLYEETLQSKEPEIGAATNEEIAEMPRF